ncbi:GNAT family N-acetyltransferase [Lapidilactobacillus achengensis]|uniref:GNAT family N-acetyltransferase n=1 Tax=Lapidilactobacillus achengensis TaxID=2486000 RepID=A0ABW1UPT3_9LACO|nr:GNAT family N-acetyltransferase [Lapidilactobacillus achengensis]
MVEITLRMVREEELGTVWQMQQQVFAAPSQAELRFVDSLAQIHWRFRHPQNCYYFILRGSQRIGYCQLQRDKTGQRAQIRPLVLLPPFQRQGIGGQVLRLIEAQIPEIKVWSANTSQPAGGQQIFSRQGYQQISPDHWRKIRP